LFILDNIRTCIHRMFSTFSRALSRLYNLQLLWKPANKYIHTYRMIFSTYYTVSIFRVFENIFFFIIIKYLGAWLVFNVKLYLFTFLERGDVPGLHQHSRALLQFINFWTASAFKHCQLIQSP